jgi:hypothetical protein
VINTISLTMCYSFIARRISDSASGWFLAMEVVYKSYHAGSKYELQVSFHKIMVPRGRTLQILFSFIATLSLERYTAHRWVITRAVKPYKIMSKYAGDVNH